VKGHLRAIALTQKEIAYGRVPAVVAQAQTNLPALQMHLQPAEQALRSPT
jgi:hypothetical protein